MIPVLNVQSQILEITHFGTVEYFVPWSEFSIHHLPTYWITWSIKDNYTTLKIFYHILHALWRCSAGAQISGAPVLWKYAQALTEMRRSRANFFIDDTTPSCILRSTYPRTSISCCKKVILCTGLG